MRLHRIFRFILLYKRLMSFSKEERELDAKHHIVIMNYIKEAFTNWRNKVLSSFSKLEENERKLK